MRSGSGLAVRSGMKSVVRTPVLSALFVLLLGALGAMLAVSLCVFSAVRSYLNDCDAYYRTVAELAYIGRDYPDPFVYDPVLSEQLTAHRDAFDALLADPAVLGFEAEDGGLAVFDALHRTDTAVYDSEAGVFSIYMLGYDEASEAYIGSIGEVLYAREPSGGKMAFLKVQPTEDAPLEFSKTYAMAGHFVQGGTSYLWFMPEPMTYQSGDETVTVPAYTRAVGGEIAPDSPYRTLATVLHRQNDSCPLQRTSSLEDFLPFHEEQVTLLDGRAFTEAEYRERAKVCIIPHRIAYMFSASVGDSLALTVYESGGDVYAVSADAASAPEAYTVVGIYSESADDPYRIFLPDAAAGSGTLRPVNGYRLGQFRLVNSKAEAFSERAAALLPEGFRLSVYDQGYAASAEPFWELSLLSALFFAISLLLVFAALAAQGYLLIARQHDTAMTLRALGCTRSHVQLYFLSGTALLALPAAALGALGGRLLEGRVLGILKSLSEQWSKSDLRYSISRITVTRSLAFAPETPVSVYWLAGALLLLGAALSAILFCAVALKEKKSKKRRVAVPKARGRVSNLSGRLKYAWLSIRRGGLRTVAVLLLAAVAAVFYGQLTHSALGYREQLESVRERTVLTGYASDRLGRRMTGIVLKNPDADRLIASPFLRSWNLTDTVAHARLVGVSRLRDGTEQELAPFKRPTSSFGVETLANQLAREPLLMRSASVSRHPMFYYTQPQGIDWDEGYSDETFSEEIAGSVCAMSHATAERNGVRLGDTVRLLFERTLYGATVFVEADFRVVALYRAATDDEAVLIPLNLVTVAYDAWGESVLRLTDGSYDSLTFTLNSTRDLDAFRQELEDVGYVPVRSEQRSRPVAVLDDAVYLNTTASMERQIRYIDALYTGLYALALAIGAALAWLFTAGRRSEIAVLRLLGTPPLQLLAVFAVEQVCLCTAGLLLGTAMEALLQGGVNQTQAVLLGLFFACWSLSALLSCGRLAAKPLQASLSDPE